MYFTNTTYFWIAASILLLLLLYLWNRKAKVLKIPAIFLWQVPDMPPEAGKTFKFHRLPLSFYLEAVTILLLAFAAAMPFIIKPTELPPITIILDNSFSITAQSPDGISTKDRLLRFLKKELGRYPGRTVNWIIASEHPEKTESSNTIPIEKWTCNSVDAALSDAIMFARNLNDGSEILVLTDKASNSELGTDLHWHAAGLPLPNVAFTNARRKGVKLMVELQNSSSDARRCSVTMTEQSSDKKETKLIELEANGHGKMDFICSNADNSVTVELDAGKDDAISQDNLIVLASDMRAPLSYRLMDDLPANLTVLLNKTLSKNSDYISVGKRELCIGTDAIPAGEYNRLFIHCKGSSLSGEKIIIRHDANLLTTGLDTGDLLWPADNEFDMPGEVLIYRGNTKLMTLQKNGRWLDLYLNLGINTGNLAEHTFWPSLFWNISNALRSLRPGPVNHNTLSGDVLEVLTDNDAIFFDGKEVKSVSGKVTLLPDTPGLHTVKTGESSWEIAFNILSGKESDLSACVSCDIKPRQNKTSLFLIRKSLSWLFFLLTVLLLSFHWFVLRKG